MLQIGFRSLAPGTCAWCQKERPVFTVEFADQSFVGQMCKHDLLRAISMKLGNANGKQEPKTPAAPPVVK